VLLRFFLDRFTEAKNSPAVTSKAKSALSEFQDSLSQIPEWNIDKVQRETTSMLNSLTCDYIEDLITAVFIAHTKILSAIRLHSKPRRKINITVPQPDHFMHRAMSECSRLLWANVYLFSDSVSSIERQKNVNEVNHFLDEGILQAIRNLLPVKSILRDSLQEDDEDAIHVDVKGTELETPEPVSIKATTLETHELEVPTPQVESNTEKQETFVVDTERSVGFTGIDSVFGTSGEADLLPSNEESEDLKFLGESEELNLDEIEDLDAPATVTPLAADDYETL
jgi:SHS2 domain-containing protein